MFCWMVHVCCCRDCLHRLDWLDRSKLFQKTIDSSQCFSTHLKTCVVPVDLESNRRFLIWLSRNILVVSLSETFFGLYIIYRVATQSFFFSLEWRVQFCLLVCCTYPSLSTAVNKEKNRTDQRTFLRADTRETQHTSHMWSFLTFVRSEM